MYIYIYRHIQIYTLELHLNCTFPKPVPTMCCFFQTNSFHLFCHFVSPIHVGPRGERGSVGTPGEMGCLLTRISTDKRQHASMEAEMGWTLGRVGKAPKCWNLPKNWSKGMMPQWLTLSETNSQFAPASGPGPKRNFIFLLPTIDFQGQTVSFRRVSVLGMTCQVLQVSTWILHWSLRPWFVVKFSVDQKKIHLNGPENMILICWIAVLELDDHQCIQRHFFEEITSSVQLSNLIYLNLI